VGYHLAGVLAKHFKSVDRLARQSIEDLTNVHEIGPIVAQSIYNFFNNRKNLKILDKLKKGGVHFPVEEGAAKKMPFSGQSFVLTGGLDAFTRDEARQIIEDLGGRVTSSVSKKTDYVIVGKDPGSKYDNAIKLGVKTLNEEELRKLIDR
jgi:DNA ligase (NAD+)